MFAFNNIKYSLQQQQQNKFQPHVRNFDFSALESELSNLVSKEDCNSFHNHAFFEPTHYYDCFKTSSTDTGDLATEKKVWPSATVTNTNTNTFSLFTQTVQAPERTETFRAIIKKSTNTTITTNKSAAQVHKSPEPVLRDKTPTEDHLKEKSSHKPEKSSRNSPRKLPLRSQNIDMSSYLNPSSSVSSLSDSHLSASPPTTPTHSRTRKTCSNNKPSTTQVSCSFCENNGEKKEIFMSHPLKDSLSRVVCPILRNFICPKCGESGDYAHTNKYCPETQRKRKENKIKSVLSDLN